MYKLVMIYLVCQALGQSPCFVEEAVVLDRLRGSDCEDIGKALEQTMPFAIAHRCDTYSSQRRPRVDPREEPDVGVER